MRLMRWVGVVLGWSLGVVLVALVSWVAINSAGRQVVEDSVATRLANGAGSVADPVMPRPSAVLSPSVADATTPDSPTTGSDTAEPSPTDVGVPVRDAPAASTGSPTRSPAVPTSSPPPASPPPPPATVQEPQPVANGWTTPGGYIWMECTGSRVSNAYAVPAFGWSARASQHSAEDLEVYFTRHSALIEVIGTCPGGQPHFVRGSSHDDHEDD